MTDAARAYVAVSGGIIAILIALASSLSIGPGPIFTFDKVVVGALLVGGLGALQVSVNIGNSPEARAERMARMNAKQFDTLMGKGTPPSDYPIKREPVERKLAAEYATPKVEGRASPTPLGFGTVTETPPQTDAPRRQVAEGGPSF